MKYVKYILHVLLPNEISKSYMSKVEMQKVKNEECSPLD